MAAGRHNITVEQGASFRLACAWTAAGVPVDLDGCTARAAVRTRPGGPLLLDLAPTIDADSIVIDVPAAQTAAASWTSPAVWGLDVIHPGGAVTRLLAGAATLNPDPVTGNE